MVYKYNDGRFKLGFYIIIDLNIIICNIFAMHQSNIIINSIQNQVIS